MDILTGLSHVPVCLCVRPVGELWKTNDLIWIPFGVMSRVGRGMVVLDKGRNRQRERGSFGVNVGHPIVTSGDFMA